MPRTRSLLWSELKLGLVGLVAIVLTTILVLAVGGQGGFFWQRYPLKVQFDDVRGLKTGAVVRLNGMEVGKVTDVAFAGAQVEVQMEVSRSVSDLITTDSEAAVGSLSLLGEPIVDVRASATGTPLPAGGYLRAVRGEGVPELAASAARFLEEAGTGDGTIGRLLQEDTLYHELRSLVDDAGGIIERLNRGEGTLGALANDPEAYRSLAVALGNLEAASARLLDGDGTVGLLLADRQFRDRLAGVTARLEAMTAALEAGEGTAGAILQDRRLYDDLAGSTAEARVLISELRSLVADVRADPRRYLSVRLSVF